MTGAAVHTRLTDAVVDVDLASGSGESARARALEGVDEVLAHTAVEAGLVFALVDVDFALCTSET